MNLLIVDLEATCWNDREQSIETMEIIEFGCCIYDLNEHAVLDSYSQLVRPEFSPTLSDFCVKLTGITQAMADSAPLYGDAVEQLDEWVAGYQVRVWGSWGKNDYKQISHEKLRHAVTPDFFADLEHVNLKAMWQVQKGSKRNAGLGATLKKLGMEFEGTQHRGIDDALNVARIVPHIDQSLLMLDKGPSAG